MKLAQGWKTIGDHRLWRYSHFSWELLLGTQTNSHVEDVRKIPSWFWQEKGLSSEQGSSLKGKTLFQILTAAGRRESFHLKSPLVFPHHLTEKQKSRVTALGLQIISVMARHECTGKRQKVISSGETLVKVTAPRDKPFKLCDLIRL